MNCLDTEKLISYAYRLIDEAAAAEVRAHLGNCRRCRELVEQRGRMEEALDGWKATEPTPGFDARVRRAVEAQQARPDSWRFWGLDWRRSLALAALGVLMVAAGLGLRQSHRAISRPSPVAARAAHAPSGVPVPAPLAKLPDSTVKANISLRPAHAVPKFKSVIDPGCDDKDCQALEDYDLAANFDLLSELPKGEPKVAN